MEQTNFIGIYRLMSTFKNSCIWSDLMASMFINPQMDSKMSQLGSKNDEA